MQKFAAPPGILRDPLLKSAHHDREYEIDQDQAQCDLEDRHDYAPSAGAAGRAVGIASSSVATLKLTSMRPAWPRFGGRYLGSACHLANALESTVWATPSRSTSIRR